MRGIVSGELLPLTFSSRHENRGLPGGSPPVFSRNQFTISSTTSTVIVSKFPDRGGTLGALLLP